MSRSLVPLFWNLTEKNGGGIRTDDFSTERLGGWGAVYCGDVCHHEALMLFCIWKQMKVPCMFLEIEEINIHNWQNKNNYRNFGRWFRANLNLKKSYYRKLPGTWCNSRICSILIANTSNMCADKLWSLWGLQPYTLHCHIWPFWWEFNETKSLSRMLHKWILCSLPSAIFKSSSKSC